MNDPLDWFGLEPPPLPPPEEHHAQAIGFLRMIDLAAVPYAGALVALFGIGLLMLLLAPRRHRLAVEQMGSTPVRDFIIGLVALLVILIPLSFLFRHHARGQGLPILLLLFTVGTGLSVCARHLGERILPERGPLAQTVIGLAGLILPLACPFCLPLLAVAAPLGLGAWLRLGREQPSVIESPNPSPPSTSA
jgi:hypothetical protein